MSQEDLNALGSMSDDDFLKEDFYSPSEEVTDEPGEAEELDTEEVVDEVTEDISEEEINEVQEEEQSEEEEELELDTSEEQDTLDDVEEDSVQESDFEKAIKTPFKANGKLVQVKSAEEAVSLMQKGANYNKKMAGMKEHRKIISMLESNGLTDTDKLNHLIDLSKHDKGAITKLIQDAKLDVDDLDEDGTEYAPNTYNVSDDQLDFEEVLDSIKDTPSYAQTIDVISTKWDDSSRQSLAKEPNKIAVINAHVESGLYKQITDEVEHRKMVGTLPASLSDIDSYELVGMELHPIQQPTEAVSKGNVDYVPPKSKKQDPQLNKRKKALASPKAKQSKKVVTEVDFSKLSDEAILAL